MNANLAKADVPPSLDSGMTLAADPLLVAFTAVVDRLEAAIDTESDLLTRHLPVDMVDLNRQKRQGMLELSRLMRTLSGGRPREEIARRLAILSDKLERNRIILDVQLNAVREVADIIAQVMRDAESDGTYSLRAGWQ